MRIWSASISCLVLPEEDWWSSIKFCLHIPQTGWQSIHHYVIQLGILIFHKVQKEKKKKEVQTHHVQSELDIFFLFNLHNHLIVVYLSIFYIQKQKESSASTNPIKEVKSFDYFFQKLVTSAMQVIWNYPMDYPLQMHRLFLQFQI